MNKKIHPLVSAIFSIIFPVSTFVVIQSVFSGDMISFGGFNLGFAAIILIAPLLFILFVGLGSTFAFILGLQALHSTKESPHFKILISVLATGGILSGLVELGYSSGFSMYYSPQSRRNPIRVFY